MRELRAALLSAGVFRHHEAASWGKLAILLVALAGCIAGVVLGPWWVSLLLVPAASVVSATAAMLGHEGSHRSFSASPWRNALINHITFPLLGGLAATYWKHKHDGLHHGHPNCEPEDPDIDLWPMISSQQGYERSGPARRWFQRNCQGFMFWPLSMLMPIGMRHASLMHMIRSARKHGIDRAWLVDATCLFVHYAAWLVVPSIVLGFWPVLGFYVATWTGVGLLLAMVFTPAHMGMPVVLEQHHDWLHQLETTRNLRLPAPLPWFFIGLDYQIEHHLFPKIPHQELPRASEVVRAWCAKHGLPHHTIGYRDALVDVTRFVANAWKLPARTGAEVRGAPRRAA